MTQLYTALCRSLLRRYLVENGLLNSDERMPTGFEDLPQDVYKHLCTLSEIAYDGILRQKLVFYKHELPDGFEHMGFMSECRELYVDRDMESSYNFLHLSLQEYLAAWSESQLPSTEQSKYFERELCTRPKSKFSPSLKEVTLFLAGITGLRNAFLQDLHLFESEGGTTIIPHVCRCLFEAQNYNICRQQLCLLVTGNIQQPSKVFTFQGDDMTSISGLDFYALGYCTAHSRGSWRVHGPRHTLFTYAMHYDIGAEALEMLVNGMRHQSRHHSPTGLITERNFCDTNMSTCIAWLKQLPWPVLLQLSVLALSQCKLCPKSFELLAQAIVMMPNLHSVDVSGNCNRSGEAVPESLIESLSSLKKLQCLRINNTNIESHNALKGLTNLIRTSNTLQSLHVGNSCSSPFPVPVLSTVIPSALATGVLKEFGLYNITLADMIQLSFLLPTNSTITSLILNGGLNDGLAYLSQALYTNASLTSIIASYSSSSSSRISREETIALLNDALQQNINLRNLKLVLSYRHLPHLQLRCSLRRLAHQLRRGPSGPHIKLKRAQSFPCISKYSHSPLEFLPRRQLTRSCSAPDLAVVESISSLHPSLTKIITLMSDNQMA